MKKLLYALLGIVVLLVIAVLIGPSLLDLRPRIAATVQAATGRTLRIDGPLHLALLPRLSVSASDIHLSSAPGAAAPEMLSVDNVALEAQVWPLLRGRFVVDSLVVRRPVVELELDKSGRANWAFEAPGAAKTAPGEVARPVGGGTGAGAVAFGAVTIEQGRVSYRDDSTGQRIEARDISLVAAMADPAQPLSLRGQMTLNDEPLSAELFVDSLDKVQRGEPGGVRLALDTRHMKATFGGTARQHPTPGLDGVFDLDIPSVGRLAAWLQQPLGTGPPDPGPLRIHAGFAADGTATVLRDAAITGKAIKATAEARFDGGRTPPVFDAKVDVQQANLNAYLSPEAVAPAHGSAQAPASAQTAGWSTELFDLTALGAANGTVSVALRAVSYRDLDLDRGNIQLTLADRVLKIAATRLILVQGVIDASATLDGSHGGANLEARAVIAGMQARPLLKVLAGSDRLGGTIAFESTFKGSGRTQKELVLSLDGSGMFRVTDGAIYGVNIAQTLRKAGTLGFGASQTEKTDFAELSGTYTIQAGVIDNRDMKMLAPLFRLTGAGTVPLPPRTVDYAVEAKLVPTIQGQGGADALAGVPIPIRVTGPWSNVAYQIDWDGVFHTIAADPTRLKALPGDLDKAAQGLGITLPGGGGTGQGTPADLLKAIPGMPPPPAPGTQPATPSGTLPSVPVLPLPMPKNPFGR